MRKKKNKSALNRLGSNKNREINKHSTRGRLHGKSAIPTNQVDKILKK
jgi:hypothetical protein